MRPFADLAGLVLELDTSDLRAKLAALEAAIGPFAAAIGALPSYVRERVWNVLMDLRTPHEDVAEWASLNLYDAATALRMSASGASDPLPDEDAATIRRVLEERVTTGWRPSHPRSERADNAVREYVRAALIETAPVGTCLDGQPHANGAADCDRCIFP